MFIYLNSWASIFIFKPWIFLSVLPTSPPPRGRSESETILQHHLQSPSQSLVSSSIYVKNWSIHYNQFPGFPVYSNPEISIVYLYIMTTENANTKTAAFSHSWRRRRHVAWSEDSEHSSVWILLINSYKRNSPAKQWK